MEKTTNLALPYILPSQAQKHVTHNEALDRLDIAVQLAVTASNLTAPPTTPANGERYIVGAGSAGGWSGRDGCIVAWQDGEWRFFEPMPGWVCFDIDDDALLFWDGSQWQDYNSSLTTMQNLSLLGINTTADTDNRFAAKLNKALWTAQPTGEGGSGDLRYIMNKQAPVNVLSLLMQSDYSGRAEFGLVGDDDFLIKVSADGAAWRESLRIDSASGEVEFPSSNFLSGFAVSLLADSGRFAGNSAKTELAGAFQFPSYVSVYNGSTTASGGKYITNNNDYGGTNGSLPTEIKSLIDTIRAPAARRYGVEFHAAQITMGSGTSSSPISLAGVNYYFSAFLTFGPRAPSMTFHCYLRALDAPIAYYRAAGQTIYKNGVAHSAHVQIAPSDGWVSISVYDEQDLRNGSGYNPTPLSIYAAQAGHRYLMACPALLGGITKIDDNVGIIAGINRWLP